MSASLAVLCPVLARPHRVEPTLRTFTESAPGCRVLFIPDPDDEDEIRELQRHGAEYLSIAGNYAQKIRAGVGLTNEPLILTAADDLEPHKGWLTVALRVMTDGIEVVGVNDLIPRKREHATHFLMTRRYAEQPCIDGSPGPFFGGYDHSCVDDELIATAKHRGVYAYAEDAQILHLHPDAERAEWDDTYRKGRERMRQDRRLFRRRSHLWT